MNSVHLLTQEKYRVENRFKNQVGCTECTVLASLGAQAARPACPCRACCRLPASPYAPSAPRACARAAQRPSAHAACAPVRPPPSTCAQRLYHGRVCAQAWPYRGLPRDTVQPSLLAHCHNTPTVLRYNQPSKPSQPKSLQYKNCIATQNPSL